MNKFFSFLLRLQPGGECISHVVVRPEAGPPVLARPALLLQAGRRGHLSAPPTHRLLLLDKNKDCD